MTRRLPRLLFAALALGLVVGGAALLRGWRPAWIARDETQFKLIDDFNAGSDTNLVGGRPFSEAVAGGSITQSLLRPAGSATGELACAISYTLEPGGSILWGTGLNDLDISAATHLAFRIKAGALPLPELSVELVDSAGRKARSALSQLRATTTWQPVRIPTQAFATIDFNQMSSVALSVRSPETAQQGTVLLDDVAFLGPPAVFFRSLKDNLYGFPDRAVTDADPLLKLPSAAMLRAIAQDTWGYFQDLVDRRHHLPLNYIQTKPVRVIGDYASTTDIGIYLLAVVSAYDLDFIDYLTALERLRGTLTQLHALPTWEGLFYNYYSTTNLQITRHYISSVDNGWLAAALIVVRQAFPELAALSTKLLDRMDFGVFYDPQNGQMRLGYEVGEGAFAPYHYGLIATEARIISAVAIAKQDVPEQHWFKVYRTLPKEWTWQSQIPRGTYQAYLGYDVFQGHYVYQDGKAEVAFVPSWGGSLFEFLMPTLVLDERRLAPMGLGLNNQRAVDIHIQYALEDRGLPVWGMSPCATPNNRHGGYSEYGVAALGAKGYKDEAIVTPHASMLALAFAPEAVSENLRQFLRRYPVYGPYGLYDAVDATSGEVAYRYLALDQGMSLVALNNYLNDGAIQRRFMSDPILKPVERLLRVERFFGEREMASHR